MAIVSAPPAPAGLRTAVAARVRAWLTSWQGRPRRMPTVLAPALPALLLLALTIAATADPSRTGEPYVPPAPHYVPAAITVTAR